MTNITPEDIEKNLPKELCQIVSEYCPRDELDEAIYRMTQTVIRDTEAKKQFNKAVDIEVSRFRKLVEQTYLGMQINNGYIYAPNVGILTLEQHEALRVLLDEYKPLFGQRESRIFSDFNPPRHELSYSDREEGSCFYCFISIITCCWPCYCYPTSYKKNGYVKSNIVLAIMAKHGVSK